MGTCGSVTFVPNDIISGQSKEVVPMAIELGYTRDDINLMYRSFCDRNKNNSGAISLDQLVKYHRPNSDAHAALVMTFCDLDKSGDITFEEYLLACWSALSSDDRGLPQFAFHLFDTENDGQLTANTILKMMENLCSSEIFNNDHFRKQLMDIDHHNNGFISMDNFRALVDAHPIIMTPAYSMREKLRINTLTRKRWNELSMLRRRIHNDLSSEDIIEAMKKKPKNYLKYNTKPTPTPTSPKEASPTEWKADGKKTRGMSLSVGSSSSSGPSRRKASADFEAMKNRIQSCNAYEYHTLNNPDSGKGRRNSLQSTSYDQSGKSTVKVEGVSPSSRRSTVQQESCRRSFSGRPSAQYYESHAAVGR